ncbi:MAG: hypothetical protein AAFR81_26665 [Chloroflexota bacterium]
MSEIFKLSLENGLRPWMYAYRSEAIDITVADEAITNFTIKYEFTKWFISVGDTTVTLFLRELGYLWFFGEALTNLQSSTGTSE